MKKLLALVLALVMSMSLVTISNAAFKDADKIDYKEAVDVMNAVGVFIGDEKGNFNAKENLTREQAAKIIAYLELGSKAAASTRIAAATATRCKFIWRIYGATLDEFEVTTNISAILEKGASFFGQVSMTFPWLSCSDTLLRLPAKPPYRAVLSSCPQHQLIHWNRSENAG